MKSWTAGLSVRFFSLTIVIGGEVLRKLIGKTLNDICFATLRNTEFGKHRKKMPRRK